MAFHSHQVFTLKGQCHGIFLAFCQKLAEIEINCLHSHTKCSWNIKRKISSEFLQGEQTIISFQFFLQDTSTEFENIPWTFSSCNPFSSWPSVAKDSNSFTELVWCLNKKMTNIFRLSYMLMWLLAFQWGQMRYCSFKQQESQYPGHHKWKPKVNYFPFFFVLTPPC